jgi:DNA-binding NarL/FixJ family response regulator
MTTTILLADNHVLFRQGLAQLVREQAEREIVGEAGDGEGAIRPTERLHPQIAALDVEMPRVRGLEAARRIKQRSPETRIVALSMYGDLYYRERMFEAGASAYVLKNEAIDDLVEAIAAALRGELSSAS